MQEIGDRRKQVHFLAAMLAGGRAERGAYLAVECALCPQPTSLVEKRGHLRGHSAKPRRSADDECVIVSEILDLGDGRGLVELEMRSLGYLLGRGFWNAPDIDGGAG